MNILLLARPAPAWDRLRFNLQTGAVEVPADTPVGQTAFGEGTWVLNPSDRAALDACLALAERAAEDGAPPAAHTVTAVALQSAEPEAAEAALREALARGASHALLIAGAEDADSWLATSALAAVMRRSASAFDLVALGAEAPNGAPDEIGPMLAGALGWRQVTGATTLDTPPGGVVRIRADQHWIGGLRTVTAELPAVVSLLPNPGLPVRYARAAQVLAAFRTATIERIALADLDLAAGSGPRITVRRAALAEPPPVERLAGPLDESVAVLLQALRQRR